VDALIRRAISDKRIVEFMYMGYPRIAEPHIYGKKDGALQVLAYQIGGGSSKGGLPEWRRFNLPKMLDLRLNVAFFPGQRKYHAAHSSWDEKYLTVDL